MRLLLLRHGQTPSNVLGALDTARPGAPLTPLGEAQAAAVPAALAALVETPIDAVYVSTLLRTQLTAAPLAAALGVEPTVLDGLREIEAGSLEMLADRESEGRYVATAYAWARGDLDVRMPGGQTGHEFFAAYDGAIAEILASGAKTVVAVSHGAAIRTWAAARSARIPGSSPGDHSLDNTGLVMLDGDRVRDWRLIGWHSAPIGGAALADTRAVDPTGESVEGAR